MRKLAGNEEGKIFGAGGDLTNYLREWDQYPLPLQLFICVIIIHHMWSVSHVQAVFE